MKENHRVYTADYYTIIIHASIIDTVVCSTVVARIFSRNNYFLLV